MKAGYFNVIPRVLHYKLWRTLGKPKAMPIDVVVSVTNMCNSRCKTCFIWEIYQKHPELKEKEFKTEEFEKTFQSIGKCVAWVTISGGEPYLRPDLPKICELIFENSSPGIINIATNALLPDIIKNRTKNILNDCNDAAIIINLSLDGLNSKHDEIRGVKGNFIKFLDTYKRLKDLQQEFSNLQIGVHSVVSSFSIDGLLDLYKFIKDLGPDSYITEVAEERTELFTMGKNTITPEPEKYSLFVSELCQRIQRDYLKSGKSISRVTQAFRLAYYDIAAQVLKRRKQVIPCYAGYALCHVTPYGDVWPCATLGYDKPMGNLRETDYNFKKVWFSKKADAVRKYIKGRSCACPLANAHYMNLLCSFTSLMRVLRNLWTL